MMKSSHLLFAVLLAAVIPELALSDNAGTGTPAQPSAVNAADRIQSDAAAQSLAIKVGDTVVPDHEGVELKQGQQVLATLNARDTMKVTQVQGDWVGCQLERTWPEVVKVTGWVQRPDVRLPWDKVVREILDAKGVGYLPWNAAGNYEPDYSELFCKEAVLRELAGRPEVVELSLRPAGGKDGLAALGHLKRISNLRSLTLLLDGGADLTCLDGLSQMPRLESLGLGGRAVNDAALVRIRPLSQLRSLRLLEGTEVTDAGFAHLQGLRQLHTLKVGGCLSRVTGTGLAYLNGSQFRTLALPGVPVTDAALVNLRTFTQLRELSLTGTQITNAGLPHLAALPSLRSLDVLGTLVTQGAVVRFRQAHPNSRIPDVDSVRTWTDITGKFKIDATLMDFDAGKVSLAKADGTVKSVPIEKLSENDQRYLAARLPFSLLMQGKASAAAPAAP